MKPVFVHVFHTQREIQFSDVTLVVWLNSVDRLRAQGGHLVFLGDRNTAAYLKTLGLDRLYDEFDDEATARFQSRYDIDHGTFPAFGKFAAMEKYETPVIVDTDLITDLDLSKRAKKGIALFAHEEFCTKENVWYPDPASLHTPRGYSFPAGVNLRTLPLNTAILYIGDAQVKEFILREAVRFMSGNQVVSKARAEFIFTEQRLVPALCRSRDLPVRTVLPCRWNTDCCGFSPGRTGDNRWDDYYKLDNSRNLTHTWICKAAIENNVKFAHYLCCRGVERLMESGGEAWSVCAGIEQLAPYFRLLDRYGSTKALLRRGIVSKRLF